MRGFDTFIIVDWSAGRAKSSRPQKDAIWAGVVRHGYAAEPVYLRSRMEAERWLDETFRTELIEGRRVLAGFDFPFGYPRGFASAVTGSDDPFALWDWLEARVTDTEEGTNNRFEIAEEINRLFPDPGPFWGKHGEDAFPGIPNRKQGVVFRDFAEKRETDRIAKSASSCFQLAFPPTVGGQVLTGIPVLSRLRRREGVRVWPLDPRWDEGQIVLAEIWPGIVEESVRRFEDSIRDRAQVRLLALALSRLTEDVLAKLMDVPSEAREEAWILGSGARVLLNEALAGPEPSLEPPPLRDDCFALPPGVDWTPVDEALARLRESVSVVVGSESLPTSEAEGRVLAERAVAVRSNPPGANSAVDGYGFAHSATGEGDQVLPLVQGRAAAGQPFGGAVPPEHAVRILTGALLPEGVDTVVLDEDTATDGRQVAFRGKVKKGANTRRAGEDVAAGAEALPPGTRLEPPELALLAATGVTRTEVFRLLRVAVLSTGSEIIPSGGTPDPARTYDANRPMLLALLRDWRMEAVDLGQVPDDRECLRAALDRGAETADAILTSGGASAGDEDHVSALLGETGTRGDWRIALKPGRPLALGMWKGVPVFGLPGNPVAALVCALIFARPALALMGGEGWRTPQGFTVPAAFSKRKKAGRREYLRARMTPEGTVEVFRSEGSGRISGLAWADGLVEIGDGGRDIQPGDPVRYIPYASFR